ERRLRFDINALADAEMQLGMGLGRFMQQEATFAVLRVLLWAGLKWQDRRMTLERAGTILQQHIAGGGGLEAAGTTVTEAIMTSGLFRGVEEGVDPNMEAEVES